VSSSGLFCQPPVFELQKSGEGNAFSSSSIDELIKFDACYRVHSHVTIGDSDTTACASSGSLAASCMPRRDGTPSLSPTRCAAKHVHHDTESEWLSKTSIYRVGKHSMARLQAETATCDLGFALLRQLDSTFVVTSSDAFTPQVSLGHQHLGLD